MNVQKLLSFFIVSFIFLIILPGCEGTSSGENSGGISPGGVTVTDMTGREVFLPDTVERVAVLTAGDCEILYALGAGDLVVGRGEYCNWPEAALSVEMVQSGSETNIEQIIALTPDVVFMGTMAQEREQIKLLESAGIAVVVSQAVSISDVYAAIEMIGICVGKEREASTLVTELKKEFADIQAMASHDADRKTIYFETSPLEWGLWSAGNGTFMDEIAQMLYLENVFSDLSGWPEVSQEQVIERNPDYIITFSMHDGESGNPIQEIMSRDGWQGISAVKNGDVYMINTDEMSRPGPRLANAARSLYDVVYGDVPGENSSAA